MQDQDQSFSMQSVIAETGDEEELEEQNTAFRKRLQMVSIRPRKQDPIPNIPKFIEKIKAKLESAIKKGVQEHGGIKAWLSLKVRYSRSDDTNGKVDAYLASKANIFYNDFEIDELVSKWREQLENRNLNFVQLRSGLRLEQIEVAHLHIGRHRMLGGKYHQLPKFLENKHCIVNVQNKDNRCFGYAIISALHPENSHAMRPTKYQQYFKQHGLHNISYPVEVGKVPVLEDLLQLRINIFTYLDAEGKIRCPIYVSRKNYDREIDLLRFADHYAWIKDFTKFMSDISKNEHRLLFCKRCLSHFKKLSAYDTHSLLCSREDFDTRSILAMPKPDSKFSKCKFHNIRNQQRLPFVIYADFECLTVPSNIKSGHTIAYEHHKPIAVGVVAVSTVEEIIFPYTSYVGEDPAGWLLDMLISMEEIYKNIYLKISRWIP